ncbi:MAG TPA: helix-hairpin-helix domain-containing protein [Blastocatellia bacterium]|nr:helix-hairpin-helix domain-containing protein [Blastocatellia bacterium]
MSDSAPTSSSNAPKDNDTIAHLLEQMADLLEFKDENPFKIRSYRSAAEAIKDMDSPIADLAVAGGAAELQKVPGIGKSISTQIIEIVNTGTSPLLEALTHDTPVSVLDLRKISGVGLKTAQTLFRDFGIKSLPDLKRFAEGGGLKSVPGMGEKTLGRVLRSLDRVLPAPAVETISVPVDPSEANPDNPDDPGPEFHHS